MLVQTILNRIQKQPGFVYAAVQLVAVGDRLHLGVHLRPRRRARPRCSRCQRRGPTYDALAERRFEFVLLWGLAVFFLYVLRWVQCPRCGVRVEAIPWAKGKHDLTTTYAWFVARWARHLSWTTVGQIFHTS